MKTSPGQALIRGRPVGIRQLQTGLDGEGCRCPGGSKVPPPGPRARQPGQHRSTQVCSLLAFLGRQVTCRGNWPAAVHHPGQHMLCHRASMRRTGLGSLFSFQILLPAFWFKTELKKKTLETTADGCGIRWLILIPTADPAGSQVQTAAERTQGTVGRSEPAPGWETARTDTQKNKQLDTWTGPHGLSFTLSSPAHLQNDRGSSDLMCPQA